MEPMVVFALGIVVYFGYLTVKDIFADLQVEGILVKVQARKKKETSLNGFLVYGGRLRRIGSLIGQSGRYTTMPLDFLRTESRMLCLLRSR
jgi:hypothetical protein